MKQLLLILPLVLSGALYAQDTTTNTDTIVTDSTTRSDISSDTTTTLKSPPPSAITPTMNISNSDLCTVGVAGAVQTQILGISMGTTTRDMNCEKLKNAKTLYDMGMKVAAVSMMCQDERVFDAMMHAGTPCPYNGEIGEAAKAGWALDSGEQPSSVEEEKGLLDDTDKQTAAASGGIAALLALLLFL